MTHQELLDSIGTLAKNAIDLGETVVAIKLLEAKSTLVQMMAFDKLSDSMKATVGNGGEQ